MGKGSLQSSEWSHFLLNKIPRDQISSSNLKFLCDFPRNNKALRQGRPRDGNQCSRPRPGLLTADSQAKGSSNPAASTEFKTNQKHLNFKIQKNPNKFVSKNYKFTKTHKTGVFQRAQWRARQQSNFSTERNYCWILPPCSTEMNGEPSLTSCTLKKK